MELTRITTADMPICPELLRRAAKVAFAIGAIVSLNYDRDSLLVRMPDSDQYNFDPDNITLHAFEALGVARLRGLVMCRDGKWGRASLIIRTVFSAEDVRVQIGGSRWFNVACPNTALAMRRALVDSFCAYYDEVIAPYPEA